MFHSSSIPMKTAFPHVGPDIAADRPASGEHTL